MGSNCLKLYCTLSNPSASFSDVDVHPIKSSNHKCIALGQRDAFIAHRFYVIAVERQHFSALKKILQIWTHLQTLWKYLERFYKTELMMNLSGEHR